MDTNINQVVGYAEIDQILKGKAPLIVVMFPNYEDRTKALTEKIQLHRKAARCRQDITFLMFCLKNACNNNMLLEDLKERNIEKIKECLGDADIHEFWLEYPSNFSPNALKMPVQHLLEEKHTCSQKADILFDVSTIPKSVLFHLCEDVKEFIREQILENIFFAYYLPKTYSRTSYAQDIGLLKGLLSGEALHFLPSQSIQTILFPSRSGHEGKLLCDNLDSISRNTSYSIYFPIHKDNFMDSLDIMQANQSLIDRESYINYFYCTLDDAIKSLDGLFQKEFVKIQHLVDLRRKSIKNGEVKEEDADSLVPQVYLVAPFGSKVFLPVAYFELLNLRSVDPEVVTVEIANVKGFQYTSSYSLGTGKCTCFELNGGKIANVLHENQDL